MSSLYCLTASTAFFKSAGLMAVVLNNLSIFNDYFSFSVTVLDMDMHRKMLVRIEEKAKPEEKKYCRHNLFYIYMTKMGINFYTCKY